MRNCSSWTCSSRRGWGRLKIRSCEFPDDLLYEPEGFVWARTEPSGVIVLGPTSLLVAMAGRLTSIRAKPVGIPYGRGKTIATLESEKYFGSVRTPVAGVLVAVNEAALKKPKIVSNQPYGEGWLGRVRPDRPEEVREALQPVQAIAANLEAQIVSLRVHCYAALPDYELFEIGTECAAVLVKLNELFTRIEAGDVVHVVSDDWTAPVEMQNWSSMTGQPIIETRKEGNLYHFLIRKVS